MASPRLLALPLAASFLIIHTHARASTAQLASEFPAALPLTCSIAAPAHVQVADVDGDGFRDLVGLSDAENSLVWLRHRGTPGLSDSTFEPARTLVSFEDEFSAAGYHGLAIGDTNGDGLPDFFVNADAGRQVLGITNLGQGQVATPILLLQGGPGAWLAAGQNLSLEDVDGDGDLDLLVPNRASTSWGTEPRILENSAGVMIPWAGSPAFDRTARDLAVDDLDGDGDADIVSTGFSSYWMENTGGQYVRHPDFTIGDVYESVEAEDLDLDGDLDLIFLARDLVSVVENTGAAGGFVLRSETPKRIQVTELVDMDGDGDKDLLLLGLKSPGQGWAAPSWMENRGALDFGAAEPFGFERLKGVRSVSLGDLDGDGFQDVIVARSRSIMTVIPGQSPTGQLAFPPTRIEVSRRLDGLRDLAAADLDGDGDLDLVASSEVDGMKAALQDASGLFGDFSRIAAGPQGLATTGKCTVTDLDGDGLPDIATLDGSGSLAFALNTGGGSFGPSQVLGLPGVYVHRPRALDLDGDGDLDLVASDNVNNQFVAFDQMSPGQFDPVARQLATYSGTCRGWETPDLDGDGASDLLAEIAGIGNTRHVAFISDGLGGVVRTVLQTFPGSVSVDGPVAVELNGDGRVDIAWLNPAARTISGRERGPGLTFLPERVLLEVDAGATSLLAVHMNTDGITDFLVGYDAGTSRPAARSLSMGPWAWGPKETLVDYPRDGTLLLDVDLDGDGDIDVLSAPLGGPYLKLQRSELFAPIGVSECAPGVPNSTGLPATIGAVGSTDLADRSVLLRVSDLPPAQLTLFLTSQTPGFVAGPAGSVGNLCLGGAIGRFVGPGQAGPSTAGGTAALGVDLGSLPQPTGIVSAMAGQTWRFQAWHRDQVGGQPRSNFSNAVAVAF